MTNRSFSHFDKVCMVEALQLAARGLFTTSPNPNVGCVIASPNNTIVGRGYHSKAGTPHAEVHALREAGELAKGATAYVTLEPCSHFGRTPPCASALINAGLARVVVAMQDPYHAVAGRGLAKLQAAGIQVEVGLFAAQSAALNKGFIKRATHQLPYVRVKLAQSLDGRTALANGQSKWITGAAARHDAQFGRALSSAVLTGAGTVMADDPLLNVRLTTIEYAQGATLRRALGDSELYAEVEAYLGADAASGSATSSVSSGSSAGVEIRQPMRVVVDNRCQVHANLKLWQVEAPVWVAVPFADGGRSEPLVGSEDADLGRSDVAKLPIKAQTKPQIQNLPTHGEYLYIAPSADINRLDLAALLAELAAREVNDLWVEAGATLAGALLETGLVDELIVYTAPKLMGPDAAGLVNLPLLSSMEQVRTMRFNEVERVGEDIKFVVRVSEV